MPDRTQALDARLDASVARRLVDQIPAPVTYLDRELRIVFANQAFSVWFGLDPDELRGLHVRQVVGESVYALNQPHLEAALSGEAQRFERSLVHRDGRTRHVEANYFPDLIDGEVEGIGILITDVTSRVEAHQDLVAAEAMAELGAWIYHPQTDILTFTGEMYRIVGMDPDQPPTIKDYLRLVHPDDLEGVQASADQRIEQGIENELRYRMVVDGEVRHVHSRVRATRNPQGEVVMLRGTVQDETVAQRQAAELERANRLLADMMALVGHDLRQPSTVLQGALEQVLDGWDDLPSEVLRGMVETSLNATRRLDRMLSDVLAMINVDTGTLALRSEQHDLGTLVKEIVGDVRLVDLEVRLTGSADVLIDEFHLRQILTNLIANAGRYGRPPVTVTVKASGDEATVTVSDEGEGVPADFVDELFSRFSRAETGVAATTGGSGFGLYIVRQLVEAHGGRVEYHRNVPSGACFTVTLPVSSG